MTTALWVIVLIIGLSCLVGFAVKAAEAIKPKKSLAWRRYTKAGLAAYGQGDHAEAETQFKAALATALYLGPTTRRMEKSFKNLAKLYPDGIYMLMALAIEDTNNKERALGPNHLEVEESLEKLAGLYDGLKIYFGYHLGRWNRQAGPLWKKALSIKEKVLGMDHLDVAKCLENFGGMSFKDDSNPLRRALEIREKILGPDHLEVVRSLEKLMVSSTEFNNYPEHNPEIATHLKRVLAVREKALGGEHPLVAETHENLGHYYLNLSYGERDFFKEALAHFEKALEIREKTLGPEHPDVAMSLRALRKYYGRLKKRDEYETLRRRERKIFEKALGGPEINAYKELMELRVTKEPEDFTEGAEVSFERISVTEEKITFMKLVTKPSAESVHEEGREGGIARCEKLMPKAVLENPKMVPQQAFVTILDELYDDADIEFPEVGWEV